MKKISLLLSIVLLGLLHQNVWAQYTIDLKFNHKQHLLFESIPCDLRLLNETSRVLRVNDPRGGAKVRVRVWDVRGNLISSTGEPLIKDRIFAPPSEIVKVPLDLVHSFRLREPGSYYAVVSLSSGEKRYVSPKIYFEIVSGIELKKLISFIPPRLFSLRLINRGEGDEVLLRVQSEDKSLCYGVYPLGFTMKSYPPQMQMDSREVLHILHRATPKQFVHYQFSISGVPVAHKILESRLPNGPSLVKSDSGSLMVAGAVSEDLADASMTEKSVDLADLPKEDLEGDFELSLSGEDSLPATDTAEAAAVQMAPKEVIPVPEYLGPVGL